MKVAIPLADGKLTMHFGHCRHFALVDVDEAQRKIVARNDIEVPPHQPGLLPPWLAERGVDLVFAGGIGQRALGLFAEQGIEVIFGAPIETPEELIAGYLKGSMTTGKNGCEGHNCEH